MEFVDKWKEESSYSVASGQPLHHRSAAGNAERKFFGTGSGNLTELENVINAQAKKGYRLHTISTASGGSKGLAAVTGSRRPWYLKSWAEAFSLKRGKTLRSSLFFVPS